MRKKLIVLLMLTAALHVIPGFAEEAPLCHLNPGTRAQDISIRCKVGESVVVVDRPSNTTLISEHSFRLAFGEALFNTKRIVRILDDDSGTLCFLVRVSAPQQVQMESKVADKTWIFTGLGSAKLKSLSIKAQGKIVIADALELSENFAVEATSLYMLNTFSVLKGSFKLRYNEGFISRLNSPFRSSVENSAMILQSLSPVENPKKRQVVLNTLKHSSSSVSLASFLASYKLAFGTDLTQKNAKINDYASESEKIAYLKKYIISKIDNSKKGVIGEDLYRQLMQKKCPTCIFKDPKVGANSFDAVHIKYNDHVVQKIYVGEVKYASHGNAVLGNITIDDKRWRQLSLPYVKNKLEKMASHNDATKEIAREIATNTDQVRLRLAVFNPDKFELVVYKIGTMKQSALD